MNIKLKTTLLAIFISAFIVFFPSSVLADSCSNPSDNPCWVTKMPIPTARRDLGVAADASGKIYAVGGLGANGLVSTLEIYNPSTDSWVTKSPAPVAQYDMGFAFDPTNDKFYMAGGGGASPVSDVYEYNPATNTWTQKASLPTPDTGLRLATSGGKVYAISGAIAIANYVTNVYEYNPATNMWTVKSAIPTPRADASLVAAPNGKIYLIGGGIQNASIASVDEYDPITDTWTSKAPMSIPKSGLGASINANGNIYALGGNDPNGAFFIITVEEYDPTANTWTTKTPFPFGIFYPGMALGGDNKVYVMGGWTSNSSAINTNYAGFIPLTDLNVPLLKQTAEPWQSHEYDSAALWSPSNPTINAWGCAVTSAAMVFQYHGIKKLPDGTTLDPGTLNSWLKSQRDGYIREGWVNWLSLSRLSRLAKGINGITTFNALEYQRKHGENKSQLTDDINNGIPDILEEQGHYVVGRGIDGDSFAINDSYYNRSTLADGYGNTFLSLGRYVPSYTDLSYIMLVANPDVSLKILDNNGAEVASGFVQQPINDATDTSKHNGSVTMLYFRKPASEEYRVIVSGSIDKVYKLSSYLYDVDGNINLIDKQGIITPNLTNSFVINLDKNNADSSRINKEVTFKSAIDDVRQLDKSRLINHGVATALIQLIKNSEAMHLKNKDRLAMYLLETAEKILKISRNKLIDAKAYEILIDDIMGLKKLLT